MAHVTKLAVRAFLGPGTEFRWETARGQRWSKMTSSGGETNEEVGCGSRDEVELATRRSGNDVMERTDHVIRSTCQRGGAVMTSWNGRTT